MRIVRVLSLAALAGATNVYAVPALLSMTTSSVRVTSMSSNGRYVTALVSGVFTPSQTVIWTVDAADESAHSDFDGGTGIADAGTAAGWIAIDGGTGVPGGTNHAALLTLGADAPTILLPEPGAGDSTIASAVAADGTAVGELSDGVAQRAVWWPHGDAMTDLPLDADVAISSAKAISADGRTIAGFARTTDDPNVDIGLVWRDFAPLRITNAHGIAVGDASAVSDNGRYVVGSSYDIGPPSAWRWDAETGQVAPIPKMSFANAVSDDGTTVVGQLFTNSFGNIASNLVVWTEGRGTVPLRDVFLEYGIAMPTDAVKLLGNLSGVSRDGTRMAGSLVDGRGFALIGLHDAPDAIFVDGLEEAAISNPLQDPSFEATSANEGSNPFWQSSDSNPDAAPGSTALYDASTFSGAFPNRGFCVAQFGTWSNLKPEVQQFSQSVTLPQRDTLFLHYARYAAILPDDVGLLSVTIDDQVVELTDVSAIVPDPDFVRHSVDIGAFADGAPHTLTFTYEYQGDTGTTDGLIGIDDIVIDNRP